MCASGARPREGELGSDRPTRTNPLWRKAPLVLVRYPGLFTSLAAGAFLLSVAAAVYPLFLSASATRLVRTETAIPTITAFGSGLTYRNGTMPMPIPGQTGAIADRVGSLFDRITADPDLRPVEVSVSGSVVQVARADRLGVVRSVHLFAGAQARPNVTLAEGGGGGGAWVPDLVAGALDIHAGDEIVVTSQRSREVRLRVTGVFSSLYKGNPAGYWHPWYDDFVSYCSNCPPPPQPLLVPAGRLERIAAALGIDHAAYAWVAPARPDLTLEEARAVAVRAKAIVDRMQDPDTVESRLLNRCGTAFCNYRNGPAFESGMAQVVQNVERRLATIDGPARLLRAAGLLVALVVVGAAGAFSISARRVEATLLDARGFGPAAAGVRGALEALMPSMVGGVLGFGLSVAAVSLFGPGRVDPSATSQAVRWATLSILVAVLVIGLASGFTFTRHPHRDRGRARFLARIPWELAPAALSVWALTRLRTGGPFRIDPTTRVQTPNLLLLVFPVAFLAGLTTLVARGFALTLRWLRRRSEGFGSPLYLTVHRLAGAPGLTVLLVGASGLCLGLFVQSQTVVGSIDQTVHAKAEVFVGSDVQARIEYRNTVPERLPVPFTRVTQRLQAGTLVPSRNRFGDPFDLLAIDPATFASAAYWNPTFAERPLAELLGRLEPRPDGRVPLLVVAGPNAAPTAIAIDQLRVPVVVVGRADSFPGVSSYRPLLVMGEPALLDAVGAAPNPLDEVGAQTALWLRGDPGEVESALAAGLPYQPDLILTAHEVEDIPYIAATIDTFRVMDGLGLAAALLVIVAMLMYLQARQRSQVVSYGLSLRMGMPSAGHRRALVVELGSMLGVALLAGSALAYLAARLVVPLLDPLPGIPPGPLFLVPVVAIVVTVPVVAAVSLVGGSVTELRARRSDLGQVMRLAD